MLGIVNASPIANMLAITNSRPDTCARTRMTLLISMACEPGQATGVAEVGSVWVWAAAAAPESARVPWATR